jgi:AcrR family transcriptional regulator
MAQKVRRGREHKRLSQPERRKRTQAKLLRAAVELLVERGYSNFTVDMVSRRAGVSRGAQTNYYPTKRDLLLATAKQVTGEGVLSATPDSGASQSRAEVFAAFVEQSKRFFLDSRYTAMIELHVAGRHDRFLARELETLQRDSRQVMDLTWIKRFVATGLSQREARSLVEATNHFLRGVALLACIQSKKPRESAITEWTDILKEQFFR